jgi:hypothetical protein
MAPHHLPRFPRPPRGRAERPGAARPVRDQRLPRPLRRPDSAHGARPVGLVNRRRGGRAAPLDVGGVPRAAERRGHRRHPVRDEVVEARHRLTGRLGRHAARPASDRRRARRPGLRRGVHNQPAARGRHRRQRVGRLRLRRRAPRTGARCPGGHARPPPLLLEERQVGARAAARGDRRAGLLGGQRLPQLR